MCRCSASPPVSRTSSTIQGAGQLHVCDQVLMRPQASCRSTASCRGNGCYASRQRRHATFGGHTGAPRTHSYSPDHIYAIASLRCYLTHRLLGCQQHKWHLHCVSVAANSFQVETKSHAQTSDVRQVQIAPHHQAVLSEPGRRGRLLMGERLSHAEMGPRRQHPPAPRPKPFVPLHPAACAATRTHACTSRQPVHIRAPVGDK